MYSSFLWLPKNNKINKAASQEHRKVKVGRDQRIVQLKILLKTRSTLRPGQEFLDLTCWLLKIPQTEGAQHLLLSCLTALMEAIFSLYILVYLIFSLSVWATVGIYTPRVSWPPPICCCDLKSLKPHPLPVKPALGSGTPLCAQGPHRCYLGKKRKASWCPQNLTRSRIKSCCSGLTLFKAIKKLNFALSNHRQNMVINVNYLGCHRNVTETSGSYR